MTLSEEVFEEFCRAAGIRCDRIPTTSEKTPDYDIFLGDVHVIVKVKEVNRALPNESGATTFTIGKAVRDDLKKAGQQTKARAKYETPGMMILFEKTWQQLGPSPIKAAMYGADTVDIAVPLQAIETPTFLGRRLGGGRQLTEQHNTSISVVAHLDNESAGGPILTAYHNRHARLPIAPECLARYNILQFSLPQVDGYGIPDWVQIVDKYHC